MTIASKSKTFITLLVIYVQVHAFGSVQSLVQQHTRYITHPHQLGVHHARLLGTFRIPEGLALSDGTSTSNDTTLNGVLHVFIRGLRDVDQLQLRGFAYFEVAPRPMLWADLKIETPPAFNKWTPSLWVAAPEPYPGQSLLRTDLHVERAPDTTKPLSIRGQIAFDQAHRSVMHVEDWRRTYSLQELAGTAGPPSQTLIATTRLASDSFTSLPSGPQPTPSLPNHQQHQKKHQPSASPPPAVYSVVAQLYSAAHPARYTTLHVNWHTRLGFSGLLFYVHPGYAQELSRNAAVRALADEGHLALVRFSPLARLDHPPRPSYDQGVAHNHALLALWGGNAYAFLTDLDELLATPTPSTVQQLLAPGGCLEGAALVLLEEYDTICEPCMALRSQQQQQEEGEHAVWLSDWSLRPLRHYSLRNRSPLSVKGLASAERVHQYFVHDGHVLRPGEDKLMKLQGRECAYVAHLRNLVHTRVPSAEGYDTNVTDWLWVLHE